MVLLNNDVAVCYFAVGESYSIQAQSSELATASLFSIYCKLNLEYTVLRITISIWIVIKL